MPWNTIFALLIVVMIFIAQDRFPLQEYKAFAGSVLFIFVLTLYLCARVIRYGERK